MRIRRRVLALAISSCTVFGTANALAQSSSEPSRWAIDVGFGLNPNVNGNINSGAIGVYQGQTTAILPQSYSDVLGTGIELRFGGAYTLNSASEVRGLFIWQSADADLVPAESALAAERHPTFRAKGLEQPERRPQQLQYSAPSETGDVEHRAAGSVNDTLTEDQLKGASRNGPCPCGSGKKFKMCHGKP